MAIRIKLVFEELISILGNSCIHEHRINPSNPLCTGRKSCALLHPIGDIALLGEKLRGRNFDVPTVGVRGPRL